MTKKIEPQRDITIKDIAREAAQIGRRLEFELKPEPPHEPDALSNGGIVEFKTSPAARLDSDFSPQRIREMLTSRTTSPPQTATEAMNMASCPRDWPAQTAEAVTNVISTLQSLSETLPGVVRASAPEMRNVHPWTIVGQLHAAIAMLRDYRIACDTVAGERERANRDAATASAYHRGVEDARRVVQESDIFREGERVIAERAARKARRERAKGKAKR